MEAFIPNCSKQPLFWSLVAGFGALVIFLILIQMMGFGGCNDGWASSSIGRPGACSHHGGVNRKGGFFTFLAFAVAGYISRRIYKTLAADPPGDLQKSDKVQSSFSTMPRGKTPQNAQVLSEANESIRSETVKSLLPNATVHCCFVCGARKKFIQKGSGRNSRKVYQCTKGCVP